VGVGFLLLYLDTGRGIIRTYGSLGKALGWPQAFGGSSAASPPPTVVASTVVTIINIPAIAIGAVILAISLINALAPEFRVNALLAKNLTYFFGHVFINSTIYMSVIGVYEILPTFTGRPVEVDAPLPHCLDGHDADGARGLSASSLHGLREPAVGERAGTDRVLHERAPGARRHRRRDSGERVSVRNEWSVTSALLFVSIVGWSVGVIPAIVDGTIAINRVMHNTLWVPGHFHMYLLLGVAAMQFGFMYFLTAAKGAADGVVDRAALWAYMVAGAAFSIVFLAAGAMSVPRRWAVHERRGWDSTGSVRRSRW
jgi:cytochrome c oxidase subunit 1